MLRHSCGSPELCSRSPALGRLVGCWGQDLGSFSEATGHLLGRDPRGLTKHHLCLPHLLCGKAGTRACDGALTVSLPTGAEGRGGDAATGWGLGPYFIPNNPMGS